MAATNNLLRMLTDTDPEITAQGWELCAALSLETRLQVAQEMVADKPLWGQAARCLLPDAAPLRAGMLRNFAVDCAERIAPIWCHQFPDDPLCIDLLNVARRYADRRVDERTLLAEHRRGARARRGYQERASREPILLQAAMKVLDAALYTLTRREAALLARLVSAVARDAATCDRGDPAAASDLARWQRDRFFQRALLLAG